jgi:single-stranded DNA-binding protein
MTSVNNVVLVGNLGADPEVRSIPSDDAVVNIRLATTDRYKDKTSREMKEATEWHCVSFFGRLAEIVNEYLKKSPAVHISNHRPIYRRTQLDRDRRTRPGWKKRVEKQVSCLLSMVRAQKETAPF